MLIPQGFKQLKGDTGTTEMVVYVSDKGVGHVRTSQPVDECAGKRSLHVGADAEGFIS